VAEEAAAILIQKYPALIIAGTYAGSPHPAENATLVERVNASAADVLYVAYGAPKQSPQAATLYSATTPIAQPTAA
jgi:N-acetylglucosaminyldiphosphoundecaprenol N-acetyl-beta-D-mannosaminyltransferase